MFTKWLSAIVNFIRLFYNPGKWTTESKKVFSKETSENAATLQEPRPDSHPLRTEVHHAVKDYLFFHYDLRYNVLTDQVECRSKQTQGECFHQIDRRLLNTMVIEARNEGISCWDKDVERLIKSNFVSNYHPFHSYMSHLPAWDGVDRITPLALRVDHDPVWVNGFRRWLLAMTAQWMGISGQCANTLIPILISPQQGLRKSTFCRLLVPTELQSYYLDKFDLNAKANAEAKLGLFGLINLDEFDRYSATAMATLKNLVQLKELVVKKSYTSYYQQWGRIASFIGTSNEIDLLNDPSGSRRFLCVEVKRPIDCSPIHHAQLYAQLKQLVEEGERLWMNKQEERELQDHNSSFKKLHPEEEVFYQIFEVPTQEEDAPLFSASEIHRKLCQHAPSSMRGINVMQLGRTLSGMGLKREHTRFGNKYHLKLK